MFDTAFFTRIPLVMSFSTSTVIHPNKSIKRWDVKSPNHHLSSSASASLLSVEAGTIRDLQQPIVGLNLDLTESVDWHFRP